MAISNSAIEQLPLREHGQRATGSGRPKALNPPKLLDCSIAVISGLRVYL